MTRYVCVHGHFYQPPRENPWLEAVELQPSARPYHDWNERVTAEAYAPNVSARILDDRERIVRLVNNFEHISFNVGPSLLEWLRSSAPAVYRAILQADARATVRGGGHGPAIAQAYGHPILPLSGERDRRTHVEWGVRAFEARFGRPPEGMWLPETAVDLDSLEALAAGGLRFAVLAPHQAARWRPAGGAEEDWRPGGEGGVDPRRAYLQRLPSGREIVLFFYHGSLARGVAFEGLLADGARLAQRILSAFEPSRAEPQLVHLATDGETFGHHHRHGEMALAFALERLARVEGVELTTYGRFLARHPPQHEVEIVERSSWSCVHGVERWRGDCGCHTGGEPGWDQAWRGPLREALDGLRAELDPAWEAEAGRTFEDPWGARDAYVDVVLDRSPARIRRFLEEQAARPLEADERVAALELMELQRYALLVYTSCGWFFHDLAGIETVQVLRYAARAIELAQKRLSIDPEPLFLERLARARSNRPTLGDGRTVWDALVRPARVDLARVCLNHAVWRLVEGDESAELERAAGRRGRPGPLHAFHVQDLASGKQASDGAELRAVAVRVTSRITEESDGFLCAALQAGEPSVLAGVRRLDPAAAPGDLLASAAGPLHEALARGDVAGTLEALEAEFGPETRSLADLLRDVQVRVVHDLLRSILEDAASAYERVYRRHAPLMRFVEDLGVPQPPALELAGAFVLERRLRRALRLEPPDLEAAAAVVAEAGERGVELDTPELEAAVRAACLRLARRVERAPDDLDRLRRLLCAVELARSLPSVDLREVQDAYWRLWDGVGPRRGEAADVPTAGAAGAEGEELFLEVGRSLDFAVEAINPPRRMEGPAATPPPGSSR